MFRICQIHNPSNAQEKQVLATVLRLYQSAFSYYPEYAAKIVELVETGGGKNFEIILLVAQGDKNRVLSFTLTFYFPRLRYAYLDYFASDPERQKRGYGAALYEATREFLRDKKCRGLFMDVPPDEKDKLKDTKRLPQNKRRLAFYEQFGARPIVNTLYESTAHKANQGDLSFLVFDDFGANKPLPKKELGTMMSQILFIKGKMDEKDPKLRLILNSLQDDPAQLRAPLYAEPQAVPIVSKQDFMLDLVSSGDAYQIHHLREKGYVERPARIKAVLDGIELIPHRLHKTKSFGQKHILEVHDPKLVRFLKRAPQELKPDQLLYPNIFPIRNPHRMPKTWDVCAGYFCIDSFTPVTANAYKAALNAVNAALTGAELVLKGSQICYVACRPPGHHAERNVFGGFCYLNNAAIAANFLSKSGKVGFLDIDYHHGNGSQDIFYHRDDVYFISIHGHPRQAYPYFSGFEDEKGVGKGLGFNRNFPLFPTVDDTRYCETLMSALKLLQKFNPDYLVVSMGLDIMVGDPTGTFELTNHGMYQIGQLLKQLGKPLLIIQEGGYSMKNLRQGVKEFFKGIALA